jgi:hypothetical protein
MKRKREWRTRKHGSPNQVGKRFPVTPSGDKAGTGKKMKLPSISARKPKTKKVTIPVMDDAGQTIWLTVPHAHSERQAQIIAEQEGFHPVKEVPNVIAVEPKSKTVWGKVKDFVNKLDEKLAKEEERKYELKLDEEELTEDV